MNNKKPTSLGLNWVTGLNFIFCSTISISQSCSRKTPRHHPVPESSSCSSFSIILEDIHLCFVCFRFFTKNLSNFSLISQITWQHSIRRDVFGLLVWGYNLSKQGGHGGRDMRSGSGKPWMLVLHFISPGYSGWDFSPWNHAAHIQDRPSHLS